MKSVNLQIHYTELKKVCLSKNGWVVINSKYRKLIKPHRLLWNLSSKADLKRSHKHISIFNFHLHNTLRNAKMYQEQ